MGGGEGGPAVGPLSLERQIMLRLVGLQVVQVRIGPGRFHFLQHGLRAAVVDPGAVVALRGRAALIKRA